MLKKHAYTLLAAFLLAGGMFACNAPERGYDDVVSDYITEENDEQLLNAAAEGDEETAYKMLRRGAYINTMDSRGNTPLALAAQAGHKECVRLLLDSPDIIITTYNNYQQTPLSSADRTVRPLIEYKLSALKSLADPTPTQRLSRGEKLYLQRVMAEAASADDTNLMRFVLMLGADPNMMQLSQASPAPLLHYAIINNSHQCLRLLLQYGADIHCRGFNGPSALQLAESHQATDCIDILEEALESRHAIPPLHPALNQSRLASYFTEFSDLSDRPMPIPVEERLTDTHTETETPVEHTSSFVDESNYNRYETQAIPPDIPAEEVQQEQTSSISPSIQAPEIVDFGDGLSKESIFDSHNSSDDIFSDSISFYDDSCSLPQVANNGGGLGSTSNKGVGLEGTFYDLKKLKSGMATGLKGGAENQNAVIEELAKFFSSWNRTAVDKYYQGKHHLYASSWYLPAAKADYGPIAFGVGDPKEKDKRKWECEPSAWLVVYRGEVIAPKTGYFRFIGTGDDFLAVRFNKKTVLEAGYRLPTRWDKANPRRSWVSGHGDGENFRAEIASGKDKARRDYKFIKGIPGCKIWDDELGGLIAGTPFHVEEFEKYPIEIAISEIPGGAFGFILFIEEVDKKGEPIDKGKKKYDIFRTCDENPSPDKILQALREAGCLHGENRIEFNEEAWTWECPVEED